MANQRIRRVLTGFGWAAFCLLLTASVAVMYLGSHPPSRASGFRPPPRSDRGDRGNRGGGPNMAPRPPMVMEEDDGMDPVKGAESPRVRGTKSVPDIFSGEGLLHIEIELSRAERAKLPTQAFGRWGGGNQDRPEALATIREGGNVYTNVALHLKGAAGSFRGLNNQPAMTLNFDKHAEGQKFHGLTKISLNNSVQDPSFLSEKFCRQIFNEAGVPAPRAEHAFVTLNGRYLGPYVLIEGYNKQFLKRAFGHAKGTLYDCGFCRDVNQRLDVNVGDKDAEQKDLEELTGVCAIRNLEARKAALDKILDVEKFLRMVCVESLVVHWDGYAGNVNNYRVFHDAKTGKFVFLPHGLDQTFGSSMSRAGPDFSIRPSTRGIVARAVLGIPEYRKRSMQIVEELSKSVFEEGKLVAQLREADRLLRACVQSEMDGGMLSGLGNAVMGVSGLPQNHAGLVDDFERRIRARCASIRRQMSAPAETPTPSIAIGAEVKLSRWTTESRSGLVSGDRAEFEGQECLHLFSSGQTGVAPQNVPGARNVAGGMGGSFRTAVGLGEGVYEFSAKARTRGRGMVCLRVSGDRGVEYKSATEEWVDLIYRVTQIGEGSQVLVMEFTGDGEAWFDAKSVRLKRVE